MTIKDIAKLAGVSVATVSKVVNNKADTIHPDTRARVLQVVKEYHYAPYAVSRNQSTAKSLLIGILLKTADNSWPLINGILMAAQAQGYNVLIFDSRNDETLELKHLTSICKNKLDGLIWEPVLAESEEKLQMMRDYDIEYCFVRTPWRSDSYHIDYEKAGYIAAKKLLDYDHVNIACLAKEGSFRSNAVLEGFKRALFEHQIPFTPSMLLPLEISDCFQHILLHRITGVVSSHFVLATDLYEQLNNYNYQIPNDLSVVSLKKFSQPLRKFPNISSIGIPYFDFGAFVCGELIKKCEKIETHRKDYETEYVFDHELSLNTPYRLRSERIVVVGNINVDTVLIVPKLPGQGITSPSKKPTVLLGGKGANQAVGASRLEAEVSLIGKIGTDIDSAFVYRSIEEYGVDLQGVTCDSTCPTGHAYIQVDGNGESTITIYCGANASFSVDDIKAHERLFENAKYCLLQTEIAAETVLFAAQTAKKHGAKNILKPSAVNTVDTEILPYIDIFIPNRKELEAVTPHKGSLGEMSDYFLNHGVKAVIVTLGAEGCYLKTKNVEKKYPAVDFIAVDMTGAADAFISALAAYLLYGYSLDESIRIATYAAGFCVSKQGVTPALIDRGSLETYINRIEPMLLERTVNDVADKDLRYESPC